METITAILGIIVALGAVIFVHEFGHFIVAKKSGIKVEQFSFGFGPSIFGFQWGETRYTVNWIPLGGYVRMAGELPEDYDGPVLEGKSSDENVDHSRDFMAKPWYIRILVAVAGPFMNYAFAILIFFTFFWFLGVDEQTNRTEVGDVMVGMPAEEAGIRAGDIILEVESQPVDSFPAIALLVKDRASMETDFLVQRGKRVMSLTMVPQLNEDEGRALIGIMAAAPVFERKKIGFVQSVSESWLRCWFITSQTLLYIKEKIVKLEKPKDVAGPVGIFQMTAQAVKRGVKDFLIFIAFISVAIGLFNLFPIPMLDGGHIIYYIIEGIRRKPLSPAIIGRANIVGLALLLTLMAFATMNDIKRIRKPADKAPVVEEK